MRKGFALAALVSLFVIGTMAMPLFAAEKGLASADKSFVKDAASGGMMEVELGQVAVQNAVSQDVKDFGQRMVTDHGKANDELKSIVATKDIQLPTQMERKDKAAFEKLSKVSGNDFDKKYMQAMVKDHKKDIADFKKATKKVKDPEINAWAAKTLPTLEQHLQLAKEVAQKLGLKTK
jgi:putative membrane protein